MKNPKAYKAYQSAQGQSISPHRATIMAYEWCLAQLNFVQVKYAELRFSEGDERLIRMEQVLLELKMGLTTEYNFIPEEMREQVLAHANNIRILYEWIVEELNRIRMTKQTENMPTITKCIQDLLEAERYAEQVYFGEQQHGK